MSHTWNLRNGKVLVVEDAATASLVVVARDLKDRNDKIAVLEEILRLLRAVGGPVRARFYTLETCFVI